MCTYLSYERTRDFRDLFDNIPSRERDSRAALSSLNIFLTIKGAVSGNLKWNDVRDASKCVYGDLLQYSNVSWGQHR